MAETHKTETITKTVICPVETSNRKNDRVRGVIDEWQSIAGRIADLMPSFDTIHWQTQDSTLSRVAKREFPDSSLRSHDRYQAAYKVGEAFGSWHSNRHEKRKPAFGDGDYARFCHCGVELNENPDGWGIKIGLEPYKPEWFRVKARPYHERILSDVTDGDASTGSAELHLDDDRLSCHLTVKRDVEVPVASECDRIVGVDLGERVLYAAAVVDDDDVQRVEIEPGREFRHFRERLKEKRSSLMENDDLRGVKQCRDEHRRYTDHQTHVASREIVDIAADASPAMIVMEDLSGYRESAEEPIHDWPYHEIQTKVAYKAIEAGVPVSIVDAAGTSVTCSECGETDRSSRDRDSFECTNCGYTVHADVNAAKNIAARS